MDILFDTNIFIHRENDEVVPEDLRKLEKSLKEQGHQILIHPLSEREIRNDHNEERRVQNESRIETYPTLDFPSYPSDDDTEFRAAVPEATNTNDEVDNALLYSVYVDDVDFLVTEDKGIHSKALDLGIEDRVFPIEEGRDYFRPTDPSIRGPEAIKRTTVGELDLNDPIFDSLEGDYDFVEWARSISERTAWVNYNQDDTLGAVLILKENEVENIGARPELGRNRRLKISTLKVSERKWGSKIGELLISLAIREAINGGHEEMYLTHYVESGEDVLVELIEKYGFEEVSKEIDDESIFLKRLTPGQGDNPTPLETTKRFYPSFYDGDQVNKYLVPVQPQFHNKLFPGYAGRDATLTEFSGQFQSEGNAIKKAYLSNAKNRNLEPGDLLLFYRSHDNMEVTSLCVLEEVHYGLTNVDSISRIVGKRSVFTRRELQDMAQSPTTVLLFRWHFDLENPISYEELKKNDILSDPLQWMSEISDRDYKYIRELGGINERFTLD
ncbi:GNAT family N-acetyltransferase [Haloarcula sp. Atlit-7R]|uniref:GNAT family N-acetyltransferase n=1 Tax=Haloarcula sp. Atlit-7R TaxID=2282125 RepID=UPI000EF13FE4|nr:GNAT family N-acetyltransferase [Haloarcula sp. Atlit-7R]RLM96249.1 GNAT family N-acetyltransferase [Haloarcula sp. Atlit-7R]